MDKKRIIKHSSCLIESVDVDLIINGNLETLTEYRILNQNGGFLGKCLDLEIAKEIAETHWEKRNSPKYPQKKLKYRIHIPPSKSE